MFTFCDPLHCDPGYYNPHAQVPPPLRRAGRADQDRAVPPGVRHLHGRQAEVAPLHFPERIDWLKKKAKFNWDLILCLESLSFTKNRAYSFFFWDSVLWQNIPTEGLLHCRQRPVWPDCAPRGRHAGKQRGKRAQQRWYTDGVCLDYDPGRPSGSPSERLDSNSQSQPGRQPTIGLANVLITMLRQTTMDITLEFTKPYVWD